MKYRFLDDSKDKRYFTIVPNYVLNHADAVTKAVYLDMKRAAGEDGLCFMTEKTMCRRNKIGEKKLHKSIKYLLDHKWIEFVGMTPAKTRPVKTYRVLDIWKKNTDFYSDKKISSKSGVSKDTRQKRDMIPARRRGRRRTLIKKNKTSNEANASGLKSIGSLLKKHDSEVLKVSAIPVGGAKYRWQDLAVYWWKKLGLSGKPTTSWFKHFREDLNPMQRACSWASDSGGKDLEKLTYWALNQFKKYGKIVYEKKA